MTGEGDWLRLSNAAALITRLSGRKVSRHKLKWWIDNGNWQAEPYMTDERDQTWFVERESIIGYWETYGRRILEAVAEERKRA